MVSRVPHQSECTLNFRHNQLFEGVYTLDQSSYDQLRVSLAPKNHQLHRQRMEQNLYLRKRTQLLLHLTREYLLLIALCLFRSQYRPYNECIATLLLRK
jgi:hypothetical protein